MSRAINNVNFIVGLMVIAAASVAWAYGTFVTRSEFADVKKEVQIISRCLIEKTCSRAPVDEP